jgi:hypothetical protein
MKNDASLNRQRDDDEGEAADAIAIIRLMLSSKSNLAIGGNDCRLGDTISSVVDTVCISLRQRTNVRHADRYGVEN